MLTDWYSIRADRAVAYSLTAVARWARYFVNYDIYVGGESGQKTISEAERFTRGTGSERESVDTLPLYLVAQQVVPSHQGTTRDSSKATTIHWGANLDGATTARTAAIGSLL